MDSRRLFYRLERRLRGIELKDTHRHSILVEKLYADFLEKDRIREVLTANAISKAAIVSHERVDLEKEQQSVLEILHSLRGTVPYLSGGKTLKEEIAEERQAVVERYTEYVRSHFDTEEEFQEYVRKQRDG